MLPADIASKVAAVLDGREAAITAAALWSAVFGDVSPDRSGQIVVGRTAASLGWTKCTGRVTYYARSSVVAPLRERVRASRAARRAADAARVEADWARVR